MLTNKTLPEFNLSSIRKDVNIIVIGENSACKSTLVKNILYHHKYPTTQYVFGPDVKCEYHDIPSENIFDICDIRVVNIVLKRVVNTIKQKQTNSNNQENKIIEKKETPLETDMQNTIVFDECQYNNEWRNNQDIIDMYKNNQKYSLTNIYTVKYPCLPKDLNNHANYIFLFNQPNLGNPNITQTLSYQYFSPKNITLEKFISLLEDNTKIPYNCLVIDRDKGELFSYSTKLNEIGIKFNIIEQYFPLQKDMILAKNEKDNGSIQESSGLFSWLWSWMV